MRVTWIGGWGVAPESLRPLAEKYFSQSQHTFLAPTVQTIEILTLPMNRSAEHCSAWMAKGLPRAEQCSALQGSGEQIASLGGAWNLSPSDGVRGAPDVLVAWSLGAHRLIEAASRGVEIPGMVLLLAPFVAFPSESRLGGKCSATQVKFLRRWLQREPLAALADFHQRAGLSQPLTRPSATLSPSDGERDGVRGGPKTGELPYALPDLLEGLDRLAGDASPTLREFAARGLPRNWQGLIGDDDLLLDAETVRRSLPGCVRVRGAGHAIADLLRASRA